MVETLDVVTEFDKIFDKVKACYQCGTCAGSCPVFRVQPKFNPRRIMEQILLGQFNKILDEQQIWYCSMCYTCSVRCPQEIDVGHIIAELRNISVEQGKATEGIVAELNAIKDTGGTAAISQSVIRKREKLGLQELPASDVGEIEKLIRVTGVSDDLAKIAGPPEEACD